ncbi:hypothetical protein GOP47_0023110 [Adiantum capillus-veneris]|uniref:Uncharacterized protein n=1 Tax=Adiantum capillus-veneris TaxID=13818 RepID=A0A9D4U6R0_ADICA|nr:hypothetical protein GOP47_0023110 [Adiantum capillus-veneris]
MAPIVDSQFWNQETESSRTVDGVVHTLPFEPPPLGFQRSNRLIRSQQLLLLQEYGSFPVTPSFSDGAFSLDSVVAVSGGINWWSTFTARIQTHGLVNLLREEFEGDRTPSASGDGWAKAKQLFCQSMNALGVTSRGRLNSNTLVSVSCEVDDGLARLLSCNNLTGGIQKPWHAQASVTHKLKQHDVLLQGSWNDKCVDRRGTYWNVPHMLSLDLVSRGSSGLGYRAGVYQSSGVDRDSSEEASAPLPFGALAGICGRAAVYWEKKKDLWKDTRNQPHRPFNLLASRPRVALSTVMGGILTADSLRGGDRQERLILMDTISRVSVDVFASAGVSTQLGHFQRWFLDFSKLDVNVNVASAAALVTSTRNPEQINKEISNLPSLELTFQQQVAGPFCARVDSRFTLDSLSFKRYPQIQDLNYGFEWCPEASGALKVVAWYSPMRNEGMMEFRLLEK